MLKKYGMLIIILASSAQIIGALDNIRKCGSVHLTVSSLMNSNLELNWITACDDDEESPNFIALYDENPFSNKHLVPRELIKAEDFPEGYYRTNISFLYTDLPGNWNYRNNITISGPSCFAHWIASFSIDGEILHSQCLGIQPTWMGDNSEKLGQLKIGSLLIPGTHDSGSYGELPKFLMDYVITQDRDIWTQLVSGIRYLDFRVAYYNDKKAFYVNHDVVRISKLQPLLQQINKFVQLAPKEIVVLDFHRFPVPKVWTDEIHANLIDLVKTELGSTLMGWTDFPTDSKGPTLEYMWSKNKNVILTYPDSTIAGEYPMLWPPLEQIWADTTNVTNLKEFLDAAVERNSTDNLSVLKALMAELTPTVIDVISNTNQLRDMSNICNREVTKWVRDEWWNKANIISTDFFQGNDVINIAINANINKDQ